MSNIERIKELIVEELERSEDELREELELTRNSNYKHQLFGELLSFEKFKLFISKLSEPGEPSEPESKPSEPGEPTVPDYVKRFINEARTGKKYRDSWGNLVRIDDDVHKLLYYVIQERVTSAKVFEWVNKNRDLFAEEWLKTVREKGAAF